MATNIRALRRKQIDKFFEKTKRFFRSPVPRDGWVKEIRESLGMSMEDLALRLGTHKSRVGRIEKDEMLGKLTMETMAKAAHAMECEFVYFLVPKTSLTETLNTQVHKVTLEILSSLDKTMKLEGQGISKKALRNIFKPIKADLLRTNDRRIWKAK